MIDLKNVPEIFKGLSLYPCPLTEEQVWSLQELSAGREGEQLAEGLWAVTCKQADSSVLQFAIVEWVYDTYTAVFVQNLWAGEGIGSSLRELRHSWFGSEFDGYVFYANPEHLKLAADFLLRHFDAK